MRRLLVLPILAAALAAPASAGAVTVGIGDQEPGMFDDANFLALHIRTVRYIVPYNAMSDPEQKAEVATWMGDAQRRHLQVLVSFNHRRSDDCLTSTSAADCRLPSVAEYTREFLKFRRAYPWVKVYSPWNEANHKSQPTARNPRRAAQYFNAVRANCAGCRIVGLDVLDSTRIQDTVRYIKAFQRATKVQPTIWGLHNYSDTNRFRNKGTKAVLAAVKGQVWLTETGGVVKFGRSFPFDEERAAKATSFMFKLAKSNPRLKRLYIYEWSSAVNADRFDAGLVDPDGTPRPAYYVVRKQLLGL
jgi:hypothetical protein